MTDLLTSLCKEIKKWKKEEEDDSLNKHVRKAVEFMKKFQELLQCKVKVHDLLYFYFESFVSLTSSSI